MKFAKQFFFFLVVAFVAAGCGPSDEQRKVEKVPNIILYTNQLALQPYTLEFSQPQEDAYDLFQEEMPSVGVVDSVDHHAGLSSWLIISHTGTTFFDGQKISIYSGKGFPLSSINAFVGKRVYKAFIVSNEQNEDPEIVAETGSETSGPDELWAFDLHLHKLTHLGNGGRLLVAPNHTHLSFQRTNKHGFYSIHILDVATQTIDNLLSLREVSDSGPSWQMRWSQDSKVFNIKGSSGDFLHGNRENSRIEFDLLYLLEKRQMFALKLVVDIRTVQGQP